MSIKLTPVNNEVHAKTKFRHSADFSHLAEEQLIPVTMHEFPQAASEFPVFFVKDNESGKFHSVAMMGLKQKQNLYCQSNEWQANYMPAMLRYYPFSLTIDQEQDQAYVCFDGNSDRINETEGEALFDESGEQTEFLKNMTENLREYMLQNQVTQNVIQLLLKHDLLSSMNLSLTTTDGEKININGIYAIDNKKLEQLSDEDFLNLKKQGLLTPIYAHQTSLQQVHRLARKQLATKVK